MQIKNKKIITFFCSIILIIMMINNFCYAQAGDATSVAKQTTVTDQADFLKDLGFLSKPKQGYELDKKLTRMQGAILFIKLLGKEAEAKKKNFKHSFKDVPSSFSFYAGYISKNKMMKALDATHFGADKPMEADEFANLVLRTLGYTVNEIPAGEALDFAWDLGVITESERKQLQSEPLYKKNAVLLVYRALNSIVKSSTTTLIKKLLAENVITKAAALRYGISSDTDFYECIDYGVKDGIPFFTPDTVVTNKYEKNRYIAMEKALLISVPQHIQYAYYKHQLMDDGTEEAMIRALKKVSTADWMIEKQEKGLPWFYENNTIPGPYDYMFVGRSNYAVFVVFDADKKPIGYTVIHSLGFSEGDGNYLDITYRFEPIDCGTVKGVPFTDAFSIYKCRGIGYIMVEVERDKAQDRFEKLYSVGLMACNIGEDQMKELYTKARLNKEGIESDFGTLIVDHVEHGSAKYEDDRSKRSSSGILRSTNLVVIQAFDEQGNSIGYSVYKIVKKITL